MARIIQLFAVHFRSLTLKGMVVRSCEMQMKAIENLDPIGTMEGLGAPNYILIDAMEPFPSDVSDRYGVISIGRDLEIKPNSVYDLHLVPFDTDVTKRMAEFFQHVPSSNCLIIQDPYILKAGKSFIKSLIQSMLSGRRLSIKPVVTFFVHNSQGEHAIIEELKKEFQGVCEIESVKTRRFHDRNIYTNTTWISSDYGFMDKYDKGSTKWCAHPLSTYYDAYSKKIKELHSYLAHVEKSGSVNWMLA